MEDRNVFGVWHYRFWWIMLLFNLLFITGLIVGGLALASVLLPINARTTAYLERTVDRLENYDDPYEMEVDMRGKFAPIGEESEPIYTKTTLAVPFEQEIVVIDTIMFSETLVVPVNYNAVLQDTVLVPFGPIEIPVPLDVVVPVSVEMKTPINHPVPFSLYSKIEDTLFIETELITPMLDYEGNMVDVPNGIVMQVPVPLDEILEDAGVTELLYALLNFNKSLAP